MHRTEASPSVSSRLKTATTLEHEASERMLIPFLTGMVTRKQYIRLLRVFLQFYAPLEAQISRVLTEKDLPDLHERGHSERLRADLQALGAEGDITLPAPEFALPSPAHALGALYVIEGATLGGKHIRQMLLGRTGLALQEAQLQFFSGYGSANGARWKAFTAALDRQPDATPLIEGANHTFTLFTAWMAQHLFHEQARKL